MVKNAASQPAEHSARCQGPLTILIECRSLTRQCLSAWLEEAEPDAQIRAHETLEAAIDHQEQFVALVVWCIGGKSMASVGAQRDLDDLRERYPSVPLAVLADREEPSDIREALSRGVDGYVPTSLDRQEALEVLRFIRAGGTYVPASALLDAGGPPEKAGLPETELAMLDTASKSKPSPTHDRSSIFDGLTPREADVVERLRQGKPNKVIAHELQISESTVKVFVHRILHKLGAINRTEVAYLAQQGSDHAGVGTDSVI